MRNPPTREVQEIKYDINIFLNYFSKKCIF